MSDQGAGAIARIGRTIRRRRRALADAARTSEARLLAAQRIAHVGSWESVVGGWAEVGASQLTWTPETYRIFGMDPAAGPITLDAFVAAIHPEDRSKVEAAVTAAMASGEAYSVEHRIVWPTGEIRTVHERAEIVMGPDGRPWRLVGTVQDVTAMKAAQADLARQAAELAQAKELERLKSAFVDSVTHELRTPLTALQGYAELLEEGGDGLGPAQREYLARIRRQIRRLKLLVEDLLDAARLDAGSFQLHPVRGGLTDVVAEVEAAFGPMAHENGVRLTLDAPADLPAALLDPQRVDQVLTNLVSNALKFTPAGGEIAVRARPDGPFLRVEVADTGVGIAPEEQARLFQRFSQLEAGARKGGTGLGLSIARALVEAHGGEIGVVSASGQGATFWFTLPLASADA